MQEIRESIVLQLRSFADKAGFGECVVGLSGGLDSSVAAVLCAEAFGADKVHGVLLPGPYSTEESRSDALQLAASLQVKAITIPITAPYNVFASVIEDATGAPLAGVASENTQARCRMVVLMALSNAHGWMLVNTGNKTEAWLGYSTLYGDTAGAYAPLGNLYKTQVFALARHINETAAAQGGLAPIPQRVISKPPSAELAPGQTDEEALGATYGQLDRVLAGYFEEGRSIEDLSSTEMDEQAVRGIVERANSYAYKRALLPLAATV